MSWIAAHIKWVMLISGGLTCTMIYAAIAPQAALQSTFGETLEGPVAEIVVRNWGVLIAVVGVMLIYGAYHPPVRALALIVAAATKATFIGLLVTLGRPYLAQQAGIAAAIDVVMIVLFSLYLLTPPTTARARRGAQSLPG
jgi:energy-converting hydrogenase Eha subunit E